MHSDEELEKLTVELQDKVNKNLDAKIIYIGSKIGELFVAEKKEDVESCIGFIIIGLSNIANMQETTISDCKNILSEKSYVDKYLGHNRFLLLPAVYGDLCFASNRRKSEQINSIIRDTMEVLGVICEIAKTDINTCWNKAYSEIKDRKGAIFKDNLPKKDTA